MLVNTLHTLIEPTITALGYELIGCELLQEGKDRLFRVYVDSDVGINIDECAKISRQVGALLTVTEPLRGSYRLEVSSPGIERPLFTLAHYHRFIGKAVRLELRAARNGQRRFSGDLLAVLDQQVQIQLPDASVLSAGLDEILKAHLIAKL